MTEATDAHTSDKNTSKSKLGSIEPEKTESKKIVAAIPSDFNDKADLDREKVIIEATRLILRQHGIRKSGAAVRDSVEIAHSVFGPKEAVSALNSIGFKSSFGNIKIQKLTEDFFPLVAFFKDGGCCVLTAPASDGKISVTNPETRQSREIDLSAFEADYSGYVILARELNQSEKDEKNGHWFFSAFRKSKWIYLQVMIAAMVSNFLSLTTALLP